MEMSILLLMVAVVGNFAILIYQVVSKLSLTAIMIRELLVCYLCEDSTPIRGSVVPMLGADGRLQ